MNLTKKFKVIKLSDGSIQLQCNETKQILFLTRKQIKQLRKLSKQTSKFKN